jgi:hypothetical protein
MEFFLLAGLVFVVGVVIYLLRRHWDASRERQQDERERSELARRWPEPNRLPREFSDETAPAVLSMKPEWTLPTEKSPDGLPPTATRPDSKSPKRRA